MKHAGFGDTIKSVTDLLGIKQCGGCAKRQRYLNRLIPYKKIGTVKEDKKMRYQEISTFSGIENHRQDTNKGTLRVCENAVMGASGSLRSLPRWEKSFDINVPSSGSFLTKATDVLGNSYAISSNEGVIDSIKIFINEKPVPSKLGPLDFSSNVELSSDTQTFLNDVGSRVAIAGNGTDLKKISETLNADGKRDLVIEDLVNSGGNNIYKLEESKFPNCTMFIVGMKKSIYGAGNPQNPLTVYISEPSSTEDPFRAGIYSSAMSKVEILCSNATKITALSSYQNYVVVHTDAGVVLLYSPEQTQASTGFRVEQITAAANSGAINQNCVAGSAIIQPYYLGVDGQIYKDSSARRGPDNKPSFSDVEQVTAKAKGLWDRHIKGDLSKSFSAYDTFSGIYNFYLPNDNTSEDSPKFLGYYYHDLDQALVGPVYSNYITSITSVGDSSIMLGTSSEGSVVTCDMEQLKESLNLEAPAHEIMLPQKTKPEGNNYVAVSSIHSDNYVYSRGIHYGKLLKDSVNGVGDYPEELKDYYPECYLSVIETAYENVTNKKTVNNSLHEIAIKFQKGSYCHISTAIESDDGGYRRTPFKSTLLRNQIKTFCNLRGKTFRIRLYIISHERYDWVLTDLSLGFLEGKFLT